MQVVEGRFGGYHNKLPLAAGKENLINSQLDPSFVVNSILTFATFELVHFIVSVIPTIKFSPPFGLRTIIFGCTIEKLSVLILEVATFATSMIQTLQVVEGVFGIVQR